MERELKRRNLKGLLNLLPEIARYFWRPLLQVDCPAEVARLLGASGYK
jgi:hypothetical protein